MLNIRPIEKKDNPQLKQIITSVLIEFGAVGGGFASSDPEIDYMFENYSKKNKSYFVIEKNNLVVGGAGIAPLAGSDGSVCELQKMYFAKNVRGQGLGFQLINICLDSARNLGFQTCYLETLTNMKSAQALYKKVGFSQIEAPLGDTGHFGCNTFFSLDLTKNN